MKKLLIFIFIIFAFVGVFYVSTSLHEYSHYRDYKDFDVYNQEICLGYIDMELKGWDKVWNYRGFYVFNVDEETQLTEEYKRTDKFTELKAYSLTFIVMILFAMSFIAIIDSIFKSLEENK